MIKPATRLFVAGCVCRVLLFFIIHVLSFLPSSFNPIFCIYSLSVTNNPLAQLDISQWELQVKWSSS